MLALPPTACRCGRGSGGDPETTGPQLPKRAIGGFNESLAPIAVAGSGGAGLILAAIATAAGVVRELRVAPNRR